MRINSFFDVRGKLVKPIYSQIFQMLYDEFPDFAIKEVFFTYSHRNVIRGMHFTLPFNNNCKLIYPVFGEIEDIAFPLDVRTDKSTNFFVNRLDSEKPKLLFIPPNFAHGYEVLSDFAVVMYITNYDFDEKSEISINPLSIPHEWITKKPILSERDINSISYSSYKEKN